MFFRDGVLLPVILFLFVVRFVNVAVIILMILEVLILRGLINYPFTGNFGKVSFNSYLYGENRAKP